MPPVDVCGGASRTRSACASRWRSGVAGRPRAGDHQRRSPTRSEGTIRHRSCPGASRHPRCAHPRGPVGPEDRMWGSTVILPERLTERISQAAALAKKMWKTLNASTIQQAMLLVAIPGAGSRSFGAPRASIASMGGLGSLGDLVAPADPRPVPLSGLGAPRRSTGSRGPPRTRARCGARTASLGRTARVWREPSRIPAGVLSLAIPGCAGR